MYEEEPTIFDKHNNIHYRIVESPQHNKTSPYYFSTSDCPTTTTNHNHQNETLVLAFHSSLICFKIALCVLL